MRPCHGQQLFPGEEAEPVSKGWRWRAPAVQPGPYATAGT